MARGKWWEYLIPGHNVGLMVGDVYDSITGNSEKNAGTGVFGTRKNDSNSYQYAQSNDRVTTAKNNLDYWKGQQPEDTTGQYDSQISGTQSQLDKMNRDGFSYDYTKDAAYQQQLCHEALAEAHDLVVRLTLRVEVRTALAAAHRQCGQAVLEDLLEAQELQNACIYGRVQSQTTLVRTDCRVELYTVATVYLYVAVVVNPGYTELNHALRLNNTINDTVCFIGRILCNNRLQRHQDFAYCLQEFRLIAVLRYDLVVYTLKICVLKCKCHGNLLLLDKKIKM